MRKSTELAAKLYREHLKGDPNFLAEVEEAARMRASDDNSDRITADQFEEWAEGLVRASKESA